MKPTKILLCALAAGAMVLAAGKASATLGFFNVSGTVMTATNYSASANLDVGKIIKQSFKTKDILKLLANATGNGWFTNKGSQLAYSDAYNSDASDWYGNFVYGIFYVTNTITHGSYRLDGTSTGYYSYVEFDVYHWHFGFWDNINVGVNYVESSTDNESKGTHSSKTTLPRLLYIHDNPYEFDITDYPSVVFANDNALVIHGLGIIDFSDNSVTTTMSITMSGSGDGYFRDANYSYPVITGETTFKGKESDD